MTASVNILRNPDFDEWNGSSFLSWYGFGWCQLQRGSKFQGKISCEAVDRKHVYSGMAQDLTDVVQLGTRYEFCSSVKLSPTANEDSSELIRVLLQYKLSNQTEISYLKIAEKQVNSLDWEKLSGRVPIPFAHPTCKLESAVLHFECPNVDTNFMVAQTTLKEINDVSANHIRNPNFEVLEDTIPKYWEPFGNVKFGPGSIYNGSCRSCETHQRQALWNGIGQDLLHEVKLGHRYKFCASVRLTSDNPPTEKHRVCCTLKLKLQEDKEKYQLFALTDNVTSGDWFDLKGQLNMPLGEEDSLLETAFLYFDGPPHNVNFIISSVSLCDVTPPGVRKQLEEKECLMQKSKKIPHPENVKQGDSYPVVYLSYHKSAANRVEELKKCLSHSGVKFIDIHGTRIGEDLASAIGDTLPKAQLLVSCITREHCSDEIHQGEITLAHLNKIPICPLLLDQLSWPPRSSAMKIYEKLSYIDFSRQGNISKPMFDHFLSSIKM